MYETASPGEKRFLYMLETMGVLSKQNLLQNQVCFSMSQEEKQICVRALDHSIKNGMYNNVGKAECRAFRACICDQETSYTLTAEKLLELCAHLMDILPWDDEAPKKAAFRKEDYALASVLSERLKRELDELCKDNSQLCPAL